MRRRRHHRWTFSRGLGGHPHQHEKAGEEEAVVARDAFQKAHEALQADACRDAFAAYRKGVFALGKVAAHDESIFVMERRHSVALTRYFDGLKAMQAGIGDGLENVCLVRRSGSSPSPAGKKSQPGTSLLDF